jgi:peptide/nickel transport system permease protein
VTTQYLHWLRRAVVHFDLGRSILTSERVTDAIREHLDVTLLLNGGGVLTSLLIGVPMGIVAALRRGRILDRVLVSFAMLFGSSPAFVVAIGALYLFGVQLGWFPLFGAGSGAADRFHHLVLPALILGIGGSAFVMRITRAAMLNEFEQDYVAFARARGVSRLRVIARYALRNSLIPVLTAAGLLLVHLLTAGVFVEEVFGLPGIGSLLVSSVQGADIPVVQGLVLLFAVWIIVLNLCVDVVYVLIDPRVGFDRARG